MQGAAVEEAAARRGANPANPTGQGEGERARADPGGGDASAGAAAPAAAPGGSGDGSGSAGSGDERLRQLSPVFETTSSLERGSASETGSAPSLASGPSGHAQHGQQGINLPQVRAAARAWAGNCVADAPLRSCNCLKARSSACLTAWQGLLRLLSLVPLTSPR